MVPSVQAFLEKTLRGARTFAVSVGEARLCCMWYCEIADTYCGAERTLTRPSSDRYPMYASTSPSVAGLGVRPSSSQKPSHLRSWLKRFVQVLLEYPNSVKRHGASSPPPVALGPVSASTTSRIPSFQANLSPTPRESPTSDRARGRRAEAEWRSRRGETPVSES